MIERRPQVATRRTRAGAAGLGLMLGLGGCALGGHLPPGSSGAHDDAWLAWFSGEDIRAECGDDAPDAFRLVLRQAGDGYRVLEVLGNAAGGALMLHYSIDAGQLVRGSPPQALPGPRQRLPLSPEGFGGLVYWFDRLGVFTPAPGATDQPGEGREWLVSGCLGGNWILNIHLPPGGNTGAGAGVLARATPSAKARPALAA